MTCGKTASTELHSLARIALAVVSSIERCQALNAVIKQCLRELNMRNKHLISLALAGAAALVATGASAQDGGRFTGGYIGAHGGYGFGTAKTQMSPNDVWANSPFASDNFIYSYVRESSPADVSVRGAFGGLQTGYNISLGGGFIAGVEIDFSLANLKGRRHETTTTGILPIVGNQTTYNTDQNVDVSWMATARPKLGYQFGNAMVYATGGLALAKQSFDSNLSFPFSASATRYPASTSDTTSGWVIGAGMEHALTSNLSLKYEYLHYSFKDLSADGARVATNTSTRDYRINHTEALTLSTVRMGLNYKY
jgi:outer membrane immunogenic protein